MKESFSTVNRVGTDEQALLGGAVSGILVLGRVEEDVCTAVQLREIFIANNEDPDCLPSLYVDFDKKVLYSMYAEPASYEDFAPSGWRAVEWHFFVSQVTGKGGASASLLEALANAGIKVVFH